MISDPGKRNSRRYSSSRSSVTPPECLLLILAWGLVAASADTSRPSLADFWFSRCCTHYGELDDSFGDYLTEVKPQVAVCGNFGPNYWAAVSYARQKGEAAFWTSLGGGPVDRDWWRKLISGAHRRGVKVIGMFSLTKVYGVPDEPAGVFRFLSSDWETATLGEKPFSEPIDLMQRETGGELWEEQIYRVEGGAEYWACPSNPAWREVLKRMVSAAIPLGLDGFIIIFPQRKDCVCQHCQAGFRAWLSSRYDADPLKKLFQIENVSQFAFKSINGWYEPEEADALALEALKFSQSTLKDCFDEVFVGHGRKIKPDLILGQWNHIYRSEYSGAGQQAGTLAQLNADERCVLPSDRWCAGEDFVWYSIGNWRMYLDPAQRGLADFLLERKYLYEASGGRPSSIKADDPVRVRLYIAEAVANGGFGYPRGPRYTDPLTRSAVKTYFSFLGKNQELYHPVETHSEAALVWNRRAVHAGKTGHIEDFKRLGVLLKKNHVLFDVLLDENIRAGRLAKYGVVFVPDAKGLAPEEAEALGRFSESGRKVIVCRDKGRKAVSIRGAEGLLSSRLRAIHPAKYEALRPYLDDWLPSRSGLVASDAVSYTCFRQQVPTTPTLSRDGWFPVRRRHTTTRPFRYIIHLVNYLRDERPHRGVSGAALERPIPQEHIVVKLRLPEDCRVRSVQLLSPDGAVTGRLKHEYSEGMLSFVVPRLIVYSVAVVQTK